MYRSILIVILLPLLLNSCYSQKTIILCKDSASINYEKGKIDKKQKNNYYIVLEYGFNDTVDIYMNKNLINKQLYVTDESLGVASGKIKFNFPENKKSFLSIMVKNKNRCLKIPIDINHRIIYISLFEKEWGVTYSNRLRIYE